MRFNQFLCVSERYDMRSTRVVSGSESCASCAARSTSVDVLEEEKSGGEERRVAILSW